MKTTTNLQLPYLMASQAQKHVTHNEALDILDAIVQLSVLDRDRTEPAGTESDGERYIVAPGGTGPWTGWDGAVALRIDGGWRRLDPQAGCLAWIEDEEILVSWTGAGWSGIENTLRTLQNLSLMGLGTAADGTNPFSAKLNKALWTARYVAEGGDGDLRYTMNKENDSRVLSLLLQSNWSGRAEIGLVGTDDLAIRVSPDGSAWKDAVVVNRATGAVSFPNAAALDAAAGLTGASGSFIRFAGPASASMQAIVGPVSQSDGVPTGAIVETGSNANGRYVRWADGTQLCTQTITLNTNITISIPTFGVYRCGLQSWTFPMAFASAATIAIFGSTFNAAALSTEVQSAANGRWYFQNIVSDMTATDRIAKLTALGRWF